jgi:hypothetical protein
MLDSLITDIWHSAPALLGIGAITVAGLLAIAWYVPPLRSAALTAAGALIGLLAAYAKGVKDASDRAKQKQATAERQAVDAGTRARAGAERDAANGMRDGYDRDW